MADLSDALPAMDVSSRIGKLRAKFDDLQIDALFVTNLINIRYLTGFTGSAAMLIVSRDGARFTTDGRYEIQCAQEIGASGAKVDISVGGVQVQKDALIESAGGMSKIGLEAQSVTWGSQRKFENDWFPNAELIATDFVVEGLRKVKDVGEVARIARAAHTADAALANVLSMLKEKPTEKQFAFALDTEIRRLGAEGNSFETIVASGANGAKAHHQPSDKTIEPGELIVLDFGAKVDGYCSDMTRTLCVGEPATQTLQGIYDAVISSQQAGLDIAKAGSTCGEVDDTCRVAMTDDSWRSTFTHSTGHGIGLETHELPWVSAKQDEKLVPNHVVTVEPGIYLEGIGGVRIEDTVVITQNGCDILTEYPKELVVA